MEYLSDDELIYLIKQQNKEAERLLFSRYENNLNFMKLILKPYSNYFYDLSEIKSMLYYVMYIALEGYERDRGKFISYLALIYTREIIKEVRRKTVIVNSTECGNFDEGFGISYELDDATIDSSNLLDRLKAKYPKTYKVVFLWMHGHTQEEISKILNIKYRNVEYEIHKAKEYLRNLLEKKNCKKF
jgi:hypothetical protein